MKRRGLWIVTALYAVALFISTHIPTSKMPEVGVNDKLLHVMTYAILAALLLLSLRAGTDRPTGRTAGIVIGTCLAFGVFDELTQALPFVNRKCSLYDWFADALGTLLIVVAWLVVVRVGNSRRAP